jgi:C4-dicarboxylate-specific signal transduction histidine kinase
MKLNLHLKFWQKILAALLIVGVVPISLVGIVSVQRTRDGLTNLGVTNLTSRSGGTAAAIDSYLQSRLGDIVVVSRLPDIVRYAQSPTDASARASAREALRVAAARSSEYESIALVDLAGTIAAASVPTDEGTSVAFREYFLNAKAGSAYISDPSYSVITNRPALFFSAPVKDATGKVLAVARTRVNLAAIWDVVEADAGSVGQGSHAFLVDDYGIRLAVSETKGRRDQADSLIYRPIARLDADTVKKLAADRRFGQNTPEQLVIDPLPTLRSTIDDLKTTGKFNGTFGYGSGSTEQRGVVTRLQTKPWSYVIAVPLATYTQSADDATIGALVIVALGIVLSAAMGFWLARSLVRPLRRLVAQATRVSTGSIDFHVAHFDSHGDDVVHEVAAAFDRLLNALRFYAMNQNSDTQRHAITREVDVAAVPQRVRQ